MGRVVDVAVVSTVADVAVVSTVAEVDGESWTGPALVCADAMALFARFCGWGDATVCGLEELKELELVDLS